MALDGAFVHFLTKELKNELVGARVSQIHQPNRDEIILALRTLSGNRKLLISARANSPRVNFTENAPENPASPPMLCMLLRKKLCGSKIHDVRQPDLEIPSLTGIPRPFGRGIKLSTKAAILP